MEETLSWVSLTAPLGVPVAVGGFVSQVLVLNVLHVLARLNDTVQANFTVVFAS